MDPELRCDAHPLHALPAGSGQGDEGEVVAAAGGVARFERCAKDAIELGVVKAPVGGQVGVVLQARGAPHVGQDVLLAALRPPDPDLVHVAVEPLGSQGGQQGK